MLSEGQPLSPFLISERDTDELNLGVIRIQELLNVPRIAGISVALVHLDGTNRITLNTASDSIYYVIGGEGSFTFPAGRLDVCEGDLVFIPQGTRYSDRGVMTLLAINAPRFNRDHVETAE